MANFASSFTGKDTGVYLPSGDKVQRAQEGLNDMVRSAEELRYKVYEKNRNEFLKNASIDPVFVLSDSARKYMSQRINTFNTKWGKRAQETNYKFSEQDRLDMQTDRNLILSEQQQQQAQYEIFKQHRDLVTKNPTTFSAEEFAKAADRYMQTGIYDQTMPAYEPHDFGQALRDVYFKQKGQYPINPKGNSMVNLGGGKEALQFYSTTESDYSGLIANLIATNPNARADIFKKIEQNKQEIFSNADKDGNNVLDSGEKENAIVDWIKKKYPRQVIEGSPSTIPGYGRVGRATKFDFNNVNATNNKNTTYDLQKDITFDKTKFNSFLNLAQTETSPKTQQIQKYTDLETGAESSLNRAATFKVVGYSPDKDMIVVNLESDVIPLSKEETYLPADKQIGLKGSQYDDFLRRKFGIYREGLMNISQPTKVNKPKLY